MPSMPLLVLRILTTLSLLALMAFSIVCIENIEFASAQVWQENMRKQRLYQKAPNCFPHQNPSEVDQSLPPCQNLSAMVIDKPQKNAGNPLCYHTYPIINRFLKLRFSDSSVQTVGIVHKDMWNSIGIGDQVSVTYWEGQVEKVEAHGDSSSIIDMTGSDRGIPRILPWLAVDLLCSFFLGKLWNISRRSSDNL